MSQTKSNMPLPEVSNRRLFPTSADRQEAEKTKTENLTQYRRSYWQDYKKKVRRVFGSLKHSEFEYWSFMAKEYGRSVWGQICACACAYVQNLTLAPKDILASQKDLLVEIRHIGNNLNQAVRLGYIKANHAGRLYADPSDHDPSDHNGQVILKGMADLERRATLFETNVQAICPTQDTPQ